MLASPVSLPILPRQSLRGAKMVWVSVIVLITNVCGAGLMARFGLPSAVPLLGRKDSDDSVWGMLGLVMFVTSIAIRVTAVSSGGNLD
jgi:hypothetical protein